MPGRPPPPWLFALTYVPYGAVSAFGTQVMPNMAKKAGVAVDNIGWLSALTFVPPMIQFLYAPIVDFGPRRKHWLVIVSVIAAGCLVGACLTPIKENLELFLSLTIAASLTSGLVGSCNGGIVATSMPDSDKGKASGWINVGNLAGGAIAGGLILFMVGRDVDPLLIGLATAAMVALPALAILTVDEPAREPTGSLGEVLRTTLRDVGAIVFSKKGASALLLCLSPVGTVALGNYWSALGDDFGVSGDLLAAVLGPVAAPLIAVGALGGGYLCDRYNRRAMYLLAGVVTTLCGVGIAVLPPTETVFAIGVSLYMVITGFAYAAYSATVFDTIGEGGTAASTQYTLFSAAGNAAIAYVVVVDSRFHENYGPAGVVAADALMNIGGVIIMGLVFWRIGAFRKKPGPAATEPVAPVR
jgi:MFS family permease